MKRAEKAKVLNTASPTKVFLPYIRIFKDIAANPAVRLMTREEDCQDTSNFLEQVKAAPGRPVTARHGSP